MTYESAIEFARQCALIALDQVNSYPTPEDCFDAYHANLVDALTKVGAPDGTLLAAVCAYNDRVDEGL